MNKEEFIKEWEQCDCGIKLVILTDGDMYTADDYKISENGYTELRYAGFTKVKIPIDIIEEISGDD